MEITLKQKNALISKIDENYPTSRGEHSQFAAGVDVESVVDSIFFELGINVKKD